MSAGGTKSVVHEDNADNINCLFRGSKELLLIDPKKYEVRIVFSQEIWRMSIMENEYYGEWVLWRMSIMDNEYYREWVLWRMSIMENEYYREWVLWRMSIIENEYYGEWVL